MAELMAKWVWALSRTWSCPAPALGCTSFGVCLVPGFERVFESFLPPHNYFSSCWRRFLCSRTELFPGEGKAISESKYLWDALRVGHKITTDFYTSVILGEILTSSSSPVPLPCSPSPPCPVPLMIPNFYHDTESISPTLCRKMEKKSAETCPRAEAKLAVSPHFPALGYYCD